MAARASAAVYDEPRTRSRSDIYTGMLVISLLAMIAGCVLLYLDYDQYSSAKPPALPAAPSVSPAAAAPAGGAVPAGGPQVVPAGGGGVPAGRGGATPPAGQ
jgi:hypothetical protein